VSGNLATVIGALATVLAAVVGTYRRNSRKLDQIHVLVNSRLSDALDEIHAMRQILTDEQAAEIASSEPLEGTASTP
jgi:hypothetical protein